MKIRLTFCALVLMLTLSLTICGQPAGGGPPGSDDPPCWPPPCVPIDGGIGFLITIAAAIGIKKIYFTKK